MLMPSALPCDSSHPPVTRLQSSLFASPPASPPTSAYSGSGSGSTLGNIFNSCRALQSMLTVPGAATGINNNINNTNSNNTAGAIARRDTLPTPPMSHTALPSPMKLRLRSRRPADSANGDAIPRKKVVKRPAAPPRGVNKRRRAIDDDPGRDNDDIDSDLEVGAGSDEASSSSSSSKKEVEEDSSMRPSTPKRARIAPEVIPLGLDRADFHSLHVARGEETENQGEGREEQGADVEVEADGEEWSKEDDRILVELVLEKLRLSKTDWQDCARSLGKDRSSLGRRWRSLMVNGDVGLKSRSRRGKIHSTWR
ncbi:hypothetical protein GGS23DRAFT_546787 [Durotheca rogersii]|uniref:uncharacterized protein n=1 Tax=Durotheca rogersii TaxID=419775 RepID=UPI00221F6FBF|nr:uncharacterized protein GGS23DRAFT_546787 [Durotheca rogersii]KAI5868690.1 hypothetical protein GGS23DRAFT_546787 [Durotheca rogersii]